MVRSSRKSLSPLAGHRPAFCVSARRLWCQTGSLPPAPYRGHAAVRAAQLRHVRLAGIPVLPEKRGKEHISTGSAIVSSTPPPPSIHIKSLGNNKVDPSI